MSGIITPMNKLAIFDTIHDFYHNRPSKSDDDEEVATEKMDFIRPRIEETISNYLQKGNRHPIATILSELTEGYITSPSTKFETKVVEYFEKKLAKELYTNTSSSETFRDIVSDLDAKKAFYAGNRGKSNILILGPGEESFGQLNTKEINSLADFILNYFNGTSQERPRVTFDGKSGIVGKIFRNTEQVVNLMFPQTIADSAPTSLNLLNGRSEFIFPPSSRPNEIQATTNIYSSPDFNIYYTNKGFGNRNQFGFSLVIEGPRIARIEMPFSYNQKMGPSVNYLIDILNSLVSNNNLANIVPKKLEMLRIGSELEKVHSSLNTIPTTSQGLIFDIKRIGDQEQVLAAKSILTTYPNTIFGTIDHLCVLFARLNRINCIFQHNEDLILYRFNQVEINPAEREINETYQDAKVTLGLLEKISLINSSNIVQRIQAQYSIFKELSLNGEFSREDSKEDAGQIVTVLLRERMKDIVLKLESLNMNESTFNMNAEYYTKINTITDNLTTFIKAVDDKVSLVSTVVPFAKEYVKTINTIYESYTQVLSGFEISEKVVGGTKRIDIEKTIARDNYFLPKASNPFFTYSCSPFTGLFGNLHTISELMVKLGSGRSIRNFDFYTVLTKMGYFDNIKGITEQFYNEGVSDTLISQLDINSKLSIGMTLVEKNTVIANEFIRVFPSIQANYSKNITLPKQKGGAYIQQFTNLSDLFRNICEMSSMYIDGISTEPEITVRTIAGLTNNFPYTKELIYDILIFWQLELREIQGQTGYSYISPDTSENIISWFLSFYTLADGNKNSEVLIDDAVIYGSRSLKTYNDVFTQVVQTPGIPIECIQLIVLHLFHHLFSNTMAISFIEDIKKIKTINGIRGALNFDSASDWEKIPGILTSILIYVRRKLGFTSGGKKTRKLYKKRKSTKYTSSRRSRPYSYASLSRTYRRAPSSR
jgi:hypothetical protein